MIECKINDISGTSCVAGPKSKDSDGEQAGPVYDEQRRRHPEWRLHHTGSRRRRGPGRLLPHDERRPERCYRKFTWRNTSLGYAGAAG